MAYKRGKHGTQVSASADARYGDGVGKRVFKGKNKNYLNPQNKNSKKYAK